MVEFCAERGLCMGNTHFKDRGLHKYTRMTRGRDDVEHDKSGAGEEGYAVICAGCEGSERDGTWPFRPPCYTV